MEKPEGNEAQVVEKTAEEQAAEAAEAEAAFSAGVAKTLGKEPEAPAAKTEELKPEDKATADVAAKATAETEAKAKADAEAKAAAQAAAEKEWEGVPPVVRAKLEKLDAMPAAIDKLAGHIGGFKRTLDAITATAKAAADKQDAPVPSKVEVAEALADPEKWKQLQEDYPEWMGPVVTELAQLRKDVAAVAKVAGMPAPAVKAAEQQVIDTDAIESRAEEKSYVRLKHPDWKKMCAEPEFKPWLDRQPEGMKAKAASDEAEDAISLFDAYKAHKEKIAKDAAAKLKNDQRLAKAVTPEGSAEPPTTGTSDEDAFNRGVKRVRGAVK